MDLDDVELAAQLRETLHRAAEPVHGEGLFKEAIRSEVARRQAARTRARWTGRLVLAGAAVAAAAAVALFVLVGSDQDQVDTDGGLPPANQPRVTTTVERDEAGPSTTEAPDTTTSTTEATTTEPTTTTSTAAPLPEFPPESTELAHREPAWGLYLAVAPPGQYQAPELAAADAATQAAGYGTTGPSDIACDVGAAEALGKDPASVSAAVYFETEAQANQARAAFEARGTQVVGIAYVETGCLD